MNRLAIISVFVGAILYGAAYSSEDVKEIRPFVVLDGENSQIGEPCYFRVTYPQEWFYLWKQHDPSKYDQIPAWMLEYEGLAIQGIPQVDFEQCMVIAIFSGEKAKASSMNAVISEGEKEIEFSFQLMKNDNTKDKTVKNVCSFFFLPRIDKPLVIKEKLPYQVTPERKRFGNIQEYIRPKINYSSKELDLVEFLLKHELENPVRDRVYFIDMSYKEDPSDDFMKRFSGLGIDIKKYSDSTGYDMGGVKDIKTKKDGIILYARVLRWINEKEAEVEYGYYMHGLGARKTIQLVEYKDGSWVLKDVIKGYIS